MNSQPFSPFPPGKRVLIVDDHDDSRSLLRLILESCQLEVCDAQDAAEALAAFDAKHFDLIISDIAMPKCDGYSLIRAVRKRQENAAVPAIALTAFVRAEDRAQALLAGFDLHLGKPFQSATLIDAMIALIGASCFPGDRRDH